MPDGMAVITDDEDLLFSPSSMSKEPADSGTKRLPLRRTGNFDEEPTRKAHAPKKSKTPAPEPDPAATEDDPWSSQ